MTAAPRRAGPPTLEATLSAFADRVFRTGGRDPGDDLLPIAPERLEIYRDLVAGNYRSMLSFVFTSTLRLVDAEIGARPAANGDASRGDVVARYLSMSPASTHSTREIADRFVVFLPAAYPDLVVRRPELPDLVTLERAALRAHYHEDDPGRGATADDVETLRSGSVEEFLATSVVRAPSASILRLAHPVKALCDELDERRVPPPPGAGAEIVTVARHPVELTATMRVVTDPGASALERATPGAALRLEDLAAAWLAAAPPGLAELDEAAAFSRFGDAVLGGLADGLLRLSA